MKTLAVEKAKSRPLSTLTINRSVETQPALAASRREVNFFNAICRLLRYEGRSSAGISDSLVWIDPSVFAESGSVDTGLDSDS